MTQDDITERHPAHRSNPTVAADTRRVRETHASRLANARRDWFLANQNRLLAALVWSVPEDSWRTVINSALGAS